MRTFLDISNIFSTFGGVFDRSRRSLRRLGTGGFLASVTSITSITLLLGLFFGETLVHEEAYAEIGYAVALLSVLGSAACFGYLTLFVFRAHAGDLDLSAYFTVFSKDDLSVAESYAGEDWPLLVTLLFGKIPVLFAGLAGWVEARA